MHRLILVKHSLPEIAPERPRSEWRLSDEGRTRSVWLAERLQTYDPGRIVTSPELKAHETATIVAQVLDLALETLDALREHDDSGAPFEDERSFRVSVRRFFARPTEAVFGPETADDAHKALLGRRRAASFEGRDLDGGRSARARDVALRCAPERLGPVRLVGATRAPFVRGPGSPELRHRGGHRPPL